MSNMESRLVKVEDELKMKRDAFNDMEMKFGKTENDFVILQETHAVYRDILFELIQNPNSQEKINQTTLSKTILERCSQGQKLIISILRES